MSFDIFGQPLKRGHCEVHPHVNEEWPCSLCLMESEQRRLTESNNNAQHDMILEVEHLKMHCEHTDKLIQQAVSHLEDYSGLLEHHGYEAVAGLSDLISSMKQAIGGAA